METFKDIIHGDQPVLVDFFATWCGPCKAMTPIIETLAKEWQGKVRVIKIDTDKNHTISQHFQIQAVPTFIIFKKGEILWRASGAMEKSALEKQLKKIS